MSRVTFLMPVFNGGQYLGETLRSLLAQDYNDFDILVIDDGSTDDTVEIVETFQSTKLRLYQQENMGLVATLNKGLQMLDCALVARIDADDICYSFRLRRQIAFLEMTGAAAISSRVLNINEAGRPMGLSAGPEEFFLTSPSAIPAREPYLPHPFILARLDALQAVGGYRHAHLAEDSDLCWRLADKYRTALQDEVMGQYRLHTASVSNTSLSGARVQAFYSQLAALNALRRRQDRTEITYDVPINQARIRGASFHNLIEAFRKHLDADEAKHMAAAAAWKLLDLSTFRYLPLESKDIQIAQSALKGLSITQENQQKIEKILATVKEFHPHLFERSFLKRILPIK